MSDDTEAMIELANTLSGVFTEAIEDGYECDMVFCCAAMVLADYGRKHFGPEYLNRLAALITKRGGDALPASEGERRLQS